MIDIQSTPLAVNPVPESQTPLHDCSIENRHAQVIFRPNSFSQRMAAPYCDCDLRLRNEVSAVSARKRYFAREMPTSVTRKMSHISRRICCLGPERLSL